MNLVIDIGNSSVKAAVFSQGKLIRKYHNKQFSPSFIQNILKQYANPSIKYSILSSVINHDITTEMFLINHTTFFKLSTTTRLPIHNDYKTPKTLGKDRIAGAVGGCVIHPKHNVLIIDAGTCITYDFINKEGHYLGGGIAPGINMRYRAMHHFTAKLPYLNKQRLENFIGYNTETCIHIGATLGATHEMQGFINQYFNKFGHIKVIITGGDAQYFAAYLKSEIFVIPDLVLIGLNKILDYNANLLE